MSHPHAPVAQARQWACLPTGVLAGRKNLRVYPQFGDLWPLPYTMMWRGNHTKFRYTKTSLGRWGEGETKHRYHQYFSHAKCPTDYGKAGREFELMTVDQGKRVQKPLPEVQYVPKDAKPTWNFKTWVDPLDTLDIWQREVQYEHHIPTHLNAKRPLAVLAPTTFHKHMQLAYFEKITITVSPFLFGFGFTAQKTALDFYRLCLASRSPLPKDKVFLFYSIDDIAPTIEVTWLDGSVYTPTIYDNMKPTALVQQIMERSWLEGDRLDAAGTKLPKLGVDDYKWALVLELKKKKKAEAKAGAKK